MGLRFAICTIIKNEHRYLDEWLEYHIGIGFNAIHLYEDYGSESHQSITKKYEQVILHDYSEVPRSDYDNRDYKQVDMFKNFIDTYRGQYDWVAFIDADEFIRLEDGYTLDRLATEFSHYDCIYLQWKIYGANGHIIAPDGGLVSNYGNGVPMRYNKPQWEMKSFANLNRKIEIRNGHKVKNGVFTNGHNRTIATSYTKAWIDHYYTKSWAEWVDRFANRGDNCQSNLKINDFFQFNSELITHPDIPHNILNSALEIHIADHCNLNCKGCSHFSPIAEERMIDADELCDSLSQIPPTTLNLFPTIRLLGGEPLLYGDLTNIVDTIRKYYKAGIIRIATNGLLVEKNKSWLFPLCRRYGVCLSITIYPSINYTKIISSCKEAQINYEIYNNITKSDFVHMPLSIDGNLDREGEYKDCQHAHKWRCRQLVGTRLYPCPIMAYKNIFERKFNVTLGADEYCDLAHSTVMEVDAFLSHSYDMCAYCNQHGYTITDWGKSKLDIKEWT